MSEESVVHPHLPQVRNSWTLGTVLASATSIASLLVMLGSLVWFSAHVDSSIKIIPDMQRQQSDSQKQQVMNGEAIAVLQSQIHYTDVRFAEIQMELIKINDKLDRPQERLK